MNRVASKLIQPKRGRFLKTKTWPKSDRLGLFRLSVEPEISHRLAYRIVIFLFRKTVVVLPVGPAPGSLAMPFKAPCQKRLVDTLHAVVVMAAGQGMARATHLFVLFSRARSFTRLVPVNVLQNCPKAEAPQCATVSKACLPRHHRLPVNMGLYRYLGAQ